MSANDLRGPQVRVDRSTSSEVAQEKQDAVSRRRWLASLLVGPLLAVPLVWSAQDPEERAVVLDGITAPVPKSAGLPLHVNARVARWIDEFETTRSAEFHDLLVQREIFAEMIREKLREREMPQELLYLAMIESGMSPFAVSRVSAVGMWQFMGPTAAQYGLRVDGYVDERRDPVRATDAALDYLEYLHERFGSWNLAAAAFNAGPSRLELILNRHADGRRGDEDIYWQVRDFLPRETREYIPKLIAVTHLANGADAVGFAADVERYRYDNVFVPGMTRLDVVAEALDIDQDVLRDLNPHLLRGVTPPNEIYAVRVPVGGGAQVVMHMSDPVMFDRRADD